MSKNKGLEEAIKTTLTLNKSYGYQKGGIQLNFNLNVKSAVDLKTFLELMEAARKEIEADLKNINACGSTPSAQ